MAKQQFKNEFKGNWLAKSHNRFWKTIGWLLEELGESLASAANKAAEQKERQDRNSK